MASSSVNRGPGGRFVSNAYAAKYPERTMRESVGGNTTNNRSVPRSRLTGEFKSAEYAKRYPDRVFNHRI